METRITFPVAHEPQKIWVHFLSLIPWKQHLVQNIRRTGDRPPAVLPTRALFIRPHWVCLNWWKPPWCNGVFIHDSTWWEGLAVNASGFVNKSSKLSEGKSSNNKNESPIKDKKNEAQIFCHGVFRHQFHWCGEPADSGSNWWGLSSRKGGSHVTWLIAAICVSVLYFHNRAFESRITSSLAQSRNKHHPTLTGSATAWMILSLAPVL